ncbi:hypothetical protein [Streptomyces sp. NPDC005955]|uniref:hypothetical protein n=1 Tax=Streptomyces sp. NPDC005955 TaxID=3364738 RepID=UPI00369A381E
MVGAQFTSAPSLPPARTTLIKAAAAEAAGALPAAVFVVASALSGGGALQASRQPGGWRTAGVTGKPVHHDRTEGAEP